MNTMKENALPCPETHNGNAVNAPTSRALQPLNSKKQVTQPSPSKSSKKSNSKKKKRQATKNTNLLDTVLKDQALCSCGKKMAAKCTNQQCAHCCSGCPRHKKENGGTKTMTTTTTNENVEETKHEELLLLESSVVREVVGSVFDLESAAELDDAVKGEKPEVPAVAVESLVVQEEEIVGLALISPEASQNKSTTKTTSDEAPTKGVDVIAKEPTVIEAVVGSPLYSKIPAEADPVDSALNSSEASNNSTTKKTSDEAPKGVYVVAQEPTFVEGVVGSPLYSKIPVETVNIHDREDDDGAVVPIDIGGHHDILGSILRAIASFPNFCPE